MEIKIYSSNFVRKILLEHDLLKCELIGCGFGECVDLCHIISHRSGGSFDIDSNILILCPNHHRLFDAGKLNINPKKILKSRTWKFQDLLDPTQRLEAINVDGDYKNKVEEAVKTMEEREKVLETIDITKRGWMKKVSESWGVSKRQVKRFMGKYFPEHLEKAYKIENFNTVNRNAYDHAKTIIENKENTK